MWPTDGPYPVHWPSHSTWEPDCGTPPPAASHDDTMSYSSQPHGPGDSNPQFTEHLLTPLNYLTGYSDVLAAASTLTHNETITLVEALLQCDWTREATYLAVAKIMQDRPIPSPPDDAPDGQTADQPDDTPGAPLDPLEQPHQFRQCTIPVECIVRMPSIITLPPQLVEAIAADATEQANEMATKAIFLLGLGDISWETHMIKNTIPFQCLYSFSTYTLVNSPLCVSISVIPRMFSRQPGSITWTLDLEQGSWIMDQVSYGSWNLNPGPRTHGCWIIDLGSWILN